MSKNKHLKEFIKIFRINAFILLIFVVSPALLYQIYVKFRSGFFASLIDPSVVQPGAYYPTYINKKFSIQLFNEYSKIAYRYRSYIGWRKKKINSEYINISGPYNARKSTGESLDNSTWFFGGSTMWGFGSSDSQTIPSHFNSLTNNPVYNFGESSWNSRQSLNQLINVIGDNHNPSKVIFYEGVNDVINLCRSEVQSFPAHSNEKRIQKALNPEQAHKRISKFIFLSYIKLAKKLSFQLIDDEQSYSKPFDCDTNQLKALSIAQHLLNNWRTAYALSKSKGFEFFGILQPTLFSTKTNSQYFVAKEIKNNSLYVNQYKTVYPLILKEMERSCESDPDFCSKIINGTDWLNGMNNIFIDFCHVNSLGNKRIAERLKSLLKK